MFGSVVAALLRRRELVIGAISILFLLTCSFGPATCEVWQCPMQSRQRPFYTYR